MTEGTIKYGINNIFFIQAGEEEVECRIKGKVLGDEKTEYNPLAPGDVVLFEKVPGESGKGMIHERLKRHNVFIRWNKKKRSPQALAANVDQVICISSPVSPAFRPRFIDRVLIASEIGGIPGMILLNKEDQGIPIDVATRLTAYADIGIPFLSCSALNRTNISKLEQTLRGKRSVFIGQSGVGKSTLLNLFSIEPPRKTGKISGKYNRGTHTTCFSSMLSCRDNTYIIDTPGIREIDVCGIEAGELDAYFPEFRPFVEKCSLRDCTHFHEPGCAVIEGVTSGSIHPDRYESYRRIFARLKESAVYNYG